MIASARVLARLLVLSSVLISSHAYAQIVALGDSNTAGFGLAPQQAYPAQLEALLRSSG